MKQTLFQGINSIEIGAEMKDRRQKSGIKIAAIAAKLKIRENFLVAIENGDWHELPPGLNGRGFIRAYATEIGYNHPQIAPKAMTQNSTQLEVQSLASEQLKKRVSTPVPTVRPDVFVARKTEGIVSPDVQEILGISSRQQKSEMPEVEIAQTASGTSDSHKSNVAAGAGTFQQNLASVSHEQKNSNVNYDPLEHLMSHTQISTKETKIETSEEPPKKAAQVVEAGVAPISHPHTQEEPSDIAAMTSVPAAAAAALPTSVAETTVASVSAKNKSFFQNAALASGILVGMLVVYLTASRLWQQNSSNEQVNLESSKVEEVQNAVVKEDPVVQPQEMISPVSEGVANVATSPTAAAAEASSVSEAAPAVSLQAASVPLSVEAKPTEAAPTATPNVSLEKAPAEEQKPSEAPVAAAAGDLKVAKLIFKEPVTIRIQIDGKTIFSGEKEAGNMDLSFKKTAELLVKDGSKVSLIYADWDHGPLGTPGRERRITLNAKSL